MSTAWPEHMRAVGRLLVGSGDMTTMGQRVLERAVAEHEGQGTEGYDEGYQDGYADGREAALSEPEWEPDEDAPTTVDVPTGNYL